MIHALLLRTPAPKPVAPLRVPMANRPVRGPSPRGVSAETRRAATKGAESISVEMIPVESSAIAAVGHDAATNTVHVAFHSGGTHQFGPVTKQEFDSFRNAESLGKHFHAHIRAKAMK